MTQVPLAARPLAGLAPGDHVCCSFGSDDEQRAMVARAARGALDRGARFVYFADRSDEAVVRGFLDEDGIDTKAGLASGQIQIRRWLVPHGEVVVDAMIGSFEDLTASALADGYSALVAASEMSWWLDRRDESRRVLRYEIEVNRAFAAADLIGLCLYDRRLFAPSMLAPLEAAHSCRVRTHLYGTTATRRRLTVTEGDVILSLRGELDLESAPYIASRLAVRASEGDLVVDMSQLEFIDVSGCRALVEAAERLDAGQRMVLVDPGPHLRKILRVCGWQGHPRLVLA